MSEMTQQRTPRPLPRDLDGRDDPDPARRLWSLWRQGQQPGVADFLDQAGVRDPEEIVMALRVDQAERRRLGQWVPAEEYLEAFPAVRDDAASAIDLIFAEFLLREERGERPPLEEFLRRFPQYAEELKLQIGLHREIDGDRARPPPRPGAQAKLAVDGGTAPADRLTGYPEIPGYEVMSVLGRGGMGIVYRARQVELKRPVAIKMLIAGALASPEAASRFRVEVEAMAQAAASEHRPDLWRRPARRGAVPGAGARRGPLAGAGPGQHAAAGRVGGADDGGSGAGHPRGAPAGGGTPGPVAGQRPDG